MLQMTRSVIGCAVLTWLLCGCQQAPQPLPAAPAMPLPPVITAVSPTGSPLEGSGTLGLFRLEITEDQASLVPLRQPALTDALEIIDITSFLTASPCTDCVRIERFRRVAPQIVGIDIALRHPFPAGDASLPISGSNRADLHVFNVEGQLLSDRPAAWFPGSGQRVVPGVLRNADGYSGYLDPVLDPLVPTDASAHPYRLFFADYSAGNYNPALPTGFASVTTPPPSGHLVMPQGSGWDVREYEIDLRGGSTSCFLAIGCTFGLSVSSRTQRFSPEYRVPQHLKKAASEVHLSLLANGLEGGITTSSATLEVRVIDPSHQVPVGNALNEMAANSSIAEVRVECPGLLPAPLTMPASGGSGGGRTPADPWIGSFQITNQLGAAEGTYPVLVGVIDSYLAGQNQTPLLQGKDAIGPVPVGTNPLTGLYDLSTFATWQTLWLPVGPAGTPLPNWTVYMGNPAHQGGLGLPGPTGTFTAPTWQSGCSQWNCWGNPLPVYLDDTTAYFSNTGDGGSLPAQAVDLATRQVKWTQKFNDIPQNWLNAKGISITPEGTVVFCHENKTGNLYGLDGADGEPLWTLPAWGHLRADSYVTTDDAGNFIVGSSSCIGGCPQGAFGIYSLNPRTGAQNWHYPTADPGYAVPAYASNRVYVIVNGTMHAIDAATGAGIWTYAGLGDHRGNATTVHPDGGILIHTMNGLYCLDDNGTAATQRWVQPYNCPFYTGSGVGPDGTIHVIDYDGVFRRCDPLTGATVASMGGWEDGYAGRPTIDSNGVTYFTLRRAAANESYLVAVNPDGSQKWAYFAGAWIGSAGIPAPCSLGKDGTLYSSVRPLGLIAFRDP